MNRREFILTAGALSLTVPLMEGCAGDLGPPTGLLTGAVTFRIKWGNSSAQSALLKLTPSSGPPVTQTVRRDPSQPIQDTTVNNVAQGPAQFDGTILDASGSTLSNVNTPVVVTKKTLITISVFTIAPTHVEVTQGQTVKRGTTVSLRFTATDDAGNFAAVPLGLISYSSSDENVIATKDANGKPFIVNNAPAILGKNIGTANITVSIAIPNGTPIKSTAVPVTIVPGIGISGLDFKPSSTVPTGSTVTISTMVLGDASNVGVTASVINLQDGTSQPAPSFSLPDNAGNVSAAYAAPATSGVYQVTVASKADPTIVQTALLIVTTNGMFTPNGTVTFHFH